MYKCVGGIRHHICQFFYTSTVSGFWKFTRKKRVNRDILNLKYYIFGAFTPSIGVISQFSYVYIHICSLFTLSMGKTWFNLTKNWIMLLQFDLKHIHKVNFYPSDNNFTQALFVLLVTNMISDSHLSYYLEICWRSRVGVHCSEDEKRTSWDTIK